MSIPRRTVVAMVELELRGPRTDEEALAESREFIRAASTPWVTVHPVTLRVLKLDRPLLAEEGESELERARRLGASYKPNREEGS